jgi:hypothetical protein
MNRAVACVVGVAVALGVATELSRLAGCVPEGCGRGVLVLALAGALAFEWASHYLGTRAWLWPLARADRAAWAGVSVVAAWLALAALSSAGMRALHIDRATSTGVAFVVLTAVPVFGARLWLLAGIYGLDLGRTARLWAATRGAALGLAVAAYSVYSCSGALGGYFESLSEGVETCLLRTGP